MLKHISYAMLLMTVIQVSHAGMTATKQDKRLFQQVLGDECQAISNTSFHCSEENKEFTILARQDFDADGNLDLIGTDETSAEESNYGSASLHFILANSKGGLKAHHELVTWSRGSNNTLKVDKVTNGVTYLTASPNEGIEARSQQAKLAIIWKQGLPYEVSYLKHCGLAKMTDKTIFREVVSNVARKTTIDMHNYTQRQQEQVNFQGVSYNVDLAGCDNINMMIHAMGRRASVANVIKQLIQDTQYNSVFKQLPLKAYLKRNKPPSNSTFTLKNGWKVTIHYYGAGNEKTVVLNVDKTSNRKQTNNWNTVMRIK